MNTSVFDIIRFIFAFFCVTMSKKETVLIENETYILDAVNPFAGEYIFDEPQQRLEFIITAAIAAVLLLLFCICLKRAIKKHKNDSEKK